MVAVVALLGVLTVKLLLTHMYIYAGKFKQAYIEIKELLILLFVVRVVCSYMYIVGVHV